jgi:hypothetical protein
VSAARLRVLTVRPNHPRPPEVSRIELTLMPADRKSDRLDVYTLTEDEALELAQAALNAYAIVRRLRIGREDLARIEAIDMAAAT